MFAFAGCQAQLDEAAFRRKAEAAYQEVNVGWSIDKRKSASTVFVRGDQLDRLDVGQMFQDYQQSKKSAGDYFEAWTTAERAKVKARRRTLEMAKDDVIPIIKSGTWIRVQDLGAIGPKRLQKQIRPWRSQISPDVFAVLGIPEDKLGYRFASIAELEGIEGGPDAWLERAIQNLVRKLGDVEEGAQEVESGGQPLVLDLANKDGVAGLILDTRFRARMLERFSLPELGAAVPIRNVLVIFHPDQFTAVKPVRARTHQLYETQNHPGFRGLLRFDKETISVLEPAR